MSTAVASGAVGAAEVVERLGLHGGGAAWVASLDEAGPPRFGVSLPRTAGAIELMSRLGVDAADAADVAATLPSQTSTPERWWLLERCVHRLVEAMGNADVTHFGWPDWTAAKGDMSLERRCFMAHVYLATLPHTRAWHKSLGIPDEVSLASLADLGRHMRIHRAAFGVSGIDAAWWLTLCLRGEVFDLGRLQFTSFRLGVGDQSPWWYEVEQAAERGVGFGLGDACIGIHIPETGPMTPEACDESVHRAARFFDEFFPTGGGVRRLATCWSWLLDPQLAAWLPEASNIVRFGRRFELVPGELVGDAGIVEFVFRRSLPPGGITAAWLDSLPAGTTLERAVVAHLRAGGHWKMRSGWFDLADW